MIIIDVNQILIGSIMTQLSMSKATEVMPHFENEIRHLACNTLRAYNVKYRKKYGKMILSNDSKGATWRKDIFPYYKAKRKANKKKAKINWQSLYDMIDKVKGEIHENFPYPFLEMPGAESDDIIGVLTSKFAGTEPIMIISSDHDFLQLQKHKGVKQFSPLTKKFVTPKTASAQIDLIVKLFEGDSGDGIPNALSEDNVFVTEGKRQKSIFKKKLNEWVETIQLGGDLDDPVLENGYRRNQRLIDLSYTPEPLVSSILYNFVEEIDRAQKFDQSKVYEYLKEHRMRLLMDCLGEF